MLVVSCIVDDIRIDKRPIPSHDLAAQPRPVQEPLHPSIPVGISSFSGVTYGGTTHVGPLSLARMIQWTTPRPCVVAR
jgi:hypothetical protein